MAMGLRLSLEISSTASRSSINGHQLGLTHWVVFAGPKPLQKQPNPLKAWPKCVSSVGLLPLLEEVAAETEVYSNHK
jgi:hypothetical protein